MHWHCYLCAVTEMTPTYYLRDLERRLFLHRCITFGCCEEFRRLCRFVKCEMLHHAGETRYAYRILVGKPHLETSAWKTEEGM